MLEMPNFEAVEKGDADYPYLPANIRQEVGMGIPETRTNPVSPLQMLAASGMIAEGYLKVNSKWPFGRKKRTKEGVYLIGQGAQMGYQPVGYGRSDG